MLDAYLPGSTGWHCGDLAGKGGRGEGEGKKIAATEWNVLHALLI